MGIRKIIIYSIFAIVLVYGIYFHFILDKSAKKVASGPLSSRIENAEATIQLEENSNESKSDNMPESWHLTRTVWGRNPFENRTADQSGLPASAAPNRNVIPRVSAISLDGAATFVIANNKIIRMGEEIGAWRLIGAESGKAMFGSPDDTIWVNLGG